MMLRNYIFIGISFFIFIDNGYCQIHQPSRFETEIDDESEYYTVVPADSEGMLLIRKKPRVMEKGNVGWEYIVLDTALNRRRIDLQFLDYGYELRGYDFNDRKIYLLFEMTGNNTSDYNLEEYDLYTGKFSFTKIKKLLNIELTEFEVMDRNVIFGGYVNYKPAVVLYSIDSARTKVLPGIFQERSRLLQLVVNDEDKIIRVVTSLQLPGRRNQSINIRTFDLEGRMLENNTLTPEDRKNLITGRIVRVNRNLNIIAGTYANRRSEYSRGIFLARLDNEGDKKIYYYDYGDLQNFFNYMKAKKQEKVKNRIKRKKIRGGKAKFSYRLLVHNLVEYDGNYVLIGEAYHPVYNNYSNYGFWGNPYYPGYGFHDGYRDNTFDGYSYTHAVIIGFDRKGRLLWDNSFEINDVTTYELKPLVETSVKPDRIVLLYNYENVIRSKIIQGSEVLEGKSFDDINLKFEDDVVKDTDSRFGGLEHWYDDTFYAYGVQKIRNEKEPGVKLNREVFFVNKIIYY